MKRIFFLIALFISAITHSQTGSLTNAPATTNIDSLLVLTPSKRINHITYTNLQNKLQTYFDGVYATNVGSFPGFTSLLVDYGYTDNSSNWDIAFGRGDHALAGYLLAANESYISDVTISGNVISFIGENNAFNDVITLPGIEGITSTGTIADGDLILTLGEVGNSLVLDTANSTIAASNLIVSNDLDVIGNTNTDTLGVTGLITTGDINTTNATVDGVLDLNGTLTINGALNITGDLDFQTYKGINLQDGTLPDDAVNKGQLDAAIADKVDATDLANITFSTNTISSTAGINLIPGAGGAVTVDGVLSVELNSIENLGPGTNPNSAINKTQLDAAISGVSGGTDDQTASEVPIIDAGTLITATDVEGALQENRTAINLNTNKIEVSSIATQITYAASMPIAYTFAQPNRYVTMAGNGTLQDVSGTLSSGASIILEIKGTGTITLTNSDATTKDITVAGVSKLVYYYVLSNGNGFWFEDENDGGAGASISQYAEVVGNGSLTTIGLNHNLGTTNISSVLIREISSGEVVFPQSIVIVDANNINVIFGTAPTTNQYNITISGGNTQLVTGGGTVDGSETIVTAGTNVTVTGTGTNGSPYVINSTGGSGSFSEVAITGTGNTTIDFTTSPYYKFTFGAQNDTLNLTQPSSAKPLRLKLIQDGVGSRTITWSNDIYVPSGILPTLSTGAGGIDVINMFWNGSNFEIDEDFLDYQLVAGVVPDVTAPSAPTLVASNATNTTIDLTWSGAADNVGIVSYNVYQDNVPTNVGNVTTYQATGLALDTPYTFEVSALDAAGNESLLSNTENISTTGSGLSEIDLSGATLLTSGTVGGVNSVTAGFDNDINTNYITTLSGSGWVGFDYGSNVTITEFRLLPNQIGGSDSERANGVKIQSSSDGTTWTNASAEVSGVEGVTNYVNYFTLPLTVQTTARYFRVINFLNAKFGGSLAEIEAYN